MVPELRSRSTRCPKDAAPLELTARGAGQDARYQPKASADCDTAVCLGASVHQPRPSLYPPVCGRVTPLARARPPVSAGFKAVLKEGGFQPPRLVTSTQDSVTLPQELEAEMLFVLSMALGCSAAALTTEKGHVWTGLNGNDNYVLDHGGKGDTMPLPPPCFSTATGRNERGTSPSKTSSSNDCSVLLEDAW